MFSILNSTKKCIGVVFHKNILSSLIINIEIEQTGSNIGNNSEFDVESF